MTKPARPQPKSVRTPTLAASAVGAIAHRLFPLASALWFAALFGMGALAAGGEALAGLVGHLHLPAILPSAAPPLGTTAHILIAAGLTGLGAAFGLVLGLVLHMRVARVSLADVVRIKPAPKSYETAKSVPVEAPPAPRVRNRDAHPDAPPRRPLVVTEDVLPYHGAAAPVESAPAAPSTTEPPAWTAQVIESDAVLDPDELDHEDTPLGAFMTPHPGGLSAAHGAEVPPFFAGGTGETPPLPQSGIYGTGEATVLPPETGASIELAHAQPWYDAPDVVHDKVVADAAPVFHAGPMPLASQAAVAPHEPIAEVSLASLGLVQLIERLALAITVRQALREGVRPAAHAETTEPLLRTKPSRLGQIGDTPEPEPIQQAALHDPLARGADWADATEDHLPPRFLRAPAEPVSPTATDAPLSLSGTAGVDGERAETRYSSLVNMALVRPDTAARLSAGLEPEAVHLNDPVVPFRTQPTDTAAPAPARGATDDADRALRDALATLRRMSAQR